MSQIFPTPQILCLHIIVICLLFIGTQTPQHDWKVIEGPFEFKLVFAKARFQPIKKKNKQKNMEKYLNE